MNDKLMASMLCLTFALTGCGGGSGGGSSNDGGGAPNPDAGGEKQVQTGSVNGLSGVAYTTDTQSGVLDANGNFSYLAGETINLTLGGITIGSAQANANLLLTDFFGTLPTTAAEFRTQMRIVDQGKERYQVLEGERNYAMSVESDLHKATNLLSILMGMDSDKDISNGLDLATGQWNSKLANVSNRDLTLHYHMLDQTESHSLARLQHQHEFALATVADAVDYLYELANITISVKPLTEARSNTSAKWTETYSYDDQYRLTQRSKADRNSSDAITQVYTENYSYNDQGLKTQEEFLSDTDNNGAAEGATTINYEFNGFGKVTKRTEIQTLGEQDPITGKHQIITTGYLDNKVLITGYRKLDRVIAGDHSVSTSTYNDALRYTGETLELRDATTDERTRLVKVLSFVYNDQGLRTSYTDSRYRPGEDDPYRVSQSNYEYSGNEIKEVFVDRNNGTVQERLTIRETIADNGQITAKSVEDYDNATGNTLENRTSMAYQYEVGKGIRECIASSDNDVDGTTDSSSKVIWTLGDNGFTQFIGQSDSDGNGEFESENFNYTHIYGDQGEMTTEGHRDNKTLHYSETDAVKGVRYLVTEYQEFDRQVLNPNNSIRCGAK